MVRTILDWLGHLLWRAEPLPSPKLGLSVGLVVGVDEEPGAGTDLGLRAADIDAAERMIAHLARLGTVDRIVLVGAERLPPAWRRRLRRAARLQRRWGLLVQWEAQETPQFEHPGLAR